MSTTAVRIPPLIGSMALLTLIDRDSGETILGFDGDSEWKKEFLLLDISTEQVVSLIPNAELSPYTNSGYHIKITTTPDLIAEYDFVVPVSVAQQELRDLIEDIPTAPVIEVTDAPLTGGPWIRQAGAWVTLDSAMAAYAGQMLPDPSALDPGTLLQVNADHEWDTL